jgi:hypothetical protein
MGHTLWLLVVVLWYYVFLENGWHGPLDDDYAHFISILLLARFLLEPTHITNFNNPNPADKNLDGNLPSELSVFISLETLNLSSNQLQGTIPSELGLLTTLVEFGVQRNQLTGTVPEELANWLPTIGLIQLEFNELSGSLEMLCNHTALFLSADCSAGEDEDARIECPCCVSCCDPDVGECKLTVRGICEKDKMLFQVPNLGDDGIWYQNGTETTCECVGTGEGSEFQVTSLSCTDTACPSCSVDGTTCIINQMFGFGYNQRGNRTDYTVTFQYVKGDNTGNSVTLEQRLGSDSSSNSIAAFVNGLYCPATGVQSCSTSTSGNSGLDGYYFANCNSDLVRAGSTVDIDFCDASAATSDAVVELLTGPLAVFALQVPSLREGCFPRFPPL